MALAPFFDRVYGAVGGHIEISRDSLSKVLGNVVIEVALADSPSRNEEWIAEMTVNIISRLYPSVHLRAPSSHEEKLRQLAHRINPKIEFKETATHAIAIGIPHADAIFPSASGWVARVTSGFPETTHGPDNPYSACAAAAMACSELFRRIFLGQTSTTDVSVSLLDFSAETGSGLPIPTKNIGDVLFVGVGAVGNAALWSLARDTATSGRLILIDDETVTLSNIQRYVLGTVKNVSQQKVRIAQKLLDDTGWESEPHRTTLQQYANKHDGLSIPIVCISVDNAETRRAAQALLPKILVNGWTGDQALGISWHDFSNNSACLACLYHPHSQGVSATDQAARVLGLPPDRAAFLWVTRQPLSDEDLKAAAKTLHVGSEVLTQWKGKSLGDLYTDVVCGAVPLNLPRIGRVETVPLAHQSVMAGALMAAELLKRTNSDLAKVSQNEALVSWDTILRPPPALWSRPRPREPGCICGDVDYQNQYKHKWLENIS